MTAPRLLTHGRGNPKTNRGAVESGHRVAVLHLAPVDLAGGPTVCPHASAGCAAGCLNRSGRGGIPGPMGDRIQAARVRRTRRFLDDRPAFLADLRREIAAHERAAARSGLRPAVRLNGTSDLAWERIAPDLFDAFPGVVFWDYTKDAARVSRMLAARALRRSPTMSRAAGRMADDLRAFPLNLDLTFSRSESNGDAAADLLGRGARVAVVFRGPPPVGDLLDLGPNRDGVPVVAPVVDGDRSDLRFLDPPGVVVGLKAKGPARADRTGWVLDVP